ncbi:hypothetical protein [Streptomyces sp. NPDC059874]|uniref:hypothetical protein n=1 Tax=Streptomyces sp. NPDC059874 TaxID=3346983 RepID=UPI00364DEEB9
MPHIPGFALSGPTTEAGWEFKRVARAFGTLMERLGYAEYGVQGGDWGPRFRGSSGEEELAALSPEERERTWASWERYRVWAREKQGYADIQATRPQTLAYGRGEVRRVE